MRALLAFDQGTVKAVDDAYARLTGAGYEGRTKPWDAPWGQRYATVLDPDGKTRTYAEVAAQIGRPKAVRAVDGTNHRNPLPLLVPCHRVVGADGALVGFGGGLEVKRRLLELEGCHV